MILDTRRIQQDAGWCIVKRQELILEVGISSPVQVSRNFKFATDLGNSVRLRNNYSLMSIFRRCKIMSKVTSCDESSQQRCF